MNEYKPGSEVTCKIVQPVHGGYAVSVSDNELPGVLLTSSLHSVGDELRALFLCVQQGRMQLLYRMPSAVIELKRQLCRLDQGIGFSEDTEVAS